MPADWMMATEDESGESDVGRGLGRGRGRPAGRGCDRGGGRSAECGCPAAEFDRPDVVAPEARLVRGGAPRPCSRQQPGPCQFFSDIFHWGGLDCSWRPPRAHVAVTRRYLLVRQARGGSSRPPLRVRRRGRQGESRRRAAAGCATAAPAGRGCRCPTRKSDRGTKSNAYNGALLSITNIHSAIDACILLV